MRLTSPLGIGLRALLALIIGSSVLVMSAFVMTVFAAAILLFGLTQVGPFSLTERFFLRMVAISSLLVLPVFGFVLLAIIHRERRLLLAGTAPIADVEAASGSLEAAQIRLATQFDISPPEIRLHPDTAPFAYTTLGPEAPLISFGHAPPVIVVSRGLLERVSPRELEAVLAHEFAHIVNNDLQLTSWLLVPLVAAEFVAEREERARGDPLGWLLVTVALVGIGVFSRGRELAADRAAVRATGDPGALVAALEALADEPSRPSTDLRTHARSTNAINVFPTIDIARPTDRLRSTHPSLATRVEHVRAWADGDGT